MSRAEIEARYRKWWCLKRVRQAGSASRFKLCIGLRWVGPPSGVYGVVVLKFKGGTESTVSTPTGVYKPRKSDIEISPKDRGDWSC